MSISRRAVVRSTGALAAGAALSACTRRGRRPEPTEPTTTTPVPEPEQDLVIGSIGVASGLEAMFDKHISIAIGEARTSIDIGGGVFGRPLQMLPRRYAETPDSDIAPLVQELAAAGASAVVVSCGDPSLLAAMPALAEAGIAVVSVNSTAHELRGKEAGSAGMLFRLAPTARMLAKAFADAAMSGSGQQHATPGTVTYLARDTLAGHSLGEQMRMLIEPAGPWIRQHYFAPGQPDLGGPIDEILAEPPALVVIDAGEETPQIISEIHRRTLGPDGRQQLTIPIRTTYYNSMPWGDQVPPESMEHTTGCRPGDPAPDPLQNLMLNIDTSLASSAYEFAGPSYDAVMLIALAAQTARSTEGSQIASAIAGLLTDGEKVSDYGTAVKLLREGKKVMYQGMSGALTLGEDGDPVSAELTTFGYDEAGAQTEASGSTVDLAR